MTYDRGQDSYTYGNLHLAQQLTKQLFKSIGTSLTSAKHF